jgi:hypothetical protein
MCMVFIAKFLKSDNSLNSNFLKLILLTYCNAAPPASCPLLAIKCSDFSPSSTTITCLYRQCSTRRVAIFRLFLTHWAHLGPCNPSLGLTADAARLYCKPLYHFPRSAPREIPSKKPVSPPLRLSFVKSVTCPGLSPSSPPYTPLPILPQGLMETVCRDDAANPPSSNRVATFWATLPSLLHCRSVFLQAHAAGLLISAVSADAARLKARARIRAISALSSAAACSRLWWDWCVSMSVVVGACGCAAALCVCAGVARTPTPSRQKSHAHKGNLGS